LNHLSFGLCILFCSFTPSKFLGLRCSELNPKTTKFPPHFLSDNTGPGHPGTLYTGDFILLAANILFAIVGHRVWLGFLRAAQLNETLYERLEEVEDEEYDEDEELSDEEDLTRDQAIKTDARTHLISWSLLIKLPKVGTYYFHNLY
jgi:hypothetical protein